MNLAVETEDRLPKSNEEIWRYTSPDLFPFDVLARGAQSDKTGWRVLDLMGEDRQLPDGWSFEGDAANASPLALECLDIRGADLATDNAAMLQRGALDSIWTLKITKSCADAIVLRPVLSVSDEVQVPLLVVEVQRGVSAVLVEDLRSPWNGFLAQRLEVVCRPGSRLEWYCLEKLGDEARYLSRERFHLERDAYCVTHHVLFGSLVSRVDLDCRMVEPGANAKLSAMYHTDGQRHVDLHPSQIHLAPNCRSELSYRGVLHGRGRAVYSGFIKVSEEAQKTDAYQSNKNLLLSDRARADSIPNLEIKANDVKCSHGSSLGQVGEADLFYLMSRGIAREAAERLLVEGFWTETLKDLPEGPVRDVVQEMVTREISYGTYGRA